MSDHYGKPAETDFGCFIFQLGAKWEEVGTEAWGATTPQKLVAKHGEVAIA
jgi:hypothetical protein